MKTRAIIKNMLISKVSPSFFQILDMIFLHLHSDLLH